MANRRRNPFVWWWTVILLLLVIGLAVGLYAPARAGTVACMDRAQILDMLGREHGESVVGRGLDDGAMIELFTTREGETWTLLVTLPQRPDLTCIVGDGERWRVIEFKPWKEGA